MRLYLRIAGATLILVGSLSCGAGDQTLSAVDPGAAPAEPTYEMVASILDRACVPCHSSGRASYPSVLDDDDAGPYDTCEGIQNGIEGLLDTAVNGGSMPPGAWPRLDERERLIIRRWVEQGACAPCRPCP